ncbi:MAG: ribonuclease H-like domain-containing protein [bacterium]
MDKGREVSDLKKRLDLLRKKKKPPGDPESLDEKSRSDRLPAPQTDPSVAQESAAQEKVGASERQNMLNHLRSLITDVLRRPHDTVKEETTAPNAGLLTPDIVEGPGQSIEDLIPGEYLDTPHGPCFRVRTVYPRHHFQGSIAVSELLDLNPEPLEMLTGDPAMANMDFTKTLFLDTETTGLDTGAGVYIFLAGLGYFDEGSFVVEQYFMRDFPEEPAVLHALAERMNRFETVVTYNGKTYDWPLLESRFAMNRRQIPMQNSLHLDLLHVARRLYKHRLDSCKLTSVEAGVLGFLRIDDIPGALLPERYFRYVRSRDARFVHQAFAHNAHDIVSMAALLAGVITFMQDPLAPGCFPAEDIYAFARIQGDGGDYIGAAKSYHEALKRGLNPALYAQALMHLSLAYKRLEQWDKACEIWRTMTQTTRKTNEFPYVELAKYHEHQEKNYSEAEKWVLAAFENVPRLRFDRETHSELMHRLNRIRAKQRAFDDIT